MVTKETRANGINAPAQPVGLGLASARAKEVEQRVAPEAPPTPQD